MVGAKTALRGLGLLSGELFHQLWCVVSRQFIVLDVLNCFTIPTRISSMIIIC